ncbi:MAG: SIMPL domain-containing protein [Armatimonadota bacterium]
MRLVACMVAVVMTLGGAVMAQQAFVQPTPLTFRVTGQAEAMPEYAVIRIAADGEGETLTKAQGMQTLVENRILNVLDKYGIKRNAIQTYKFDVTPILPASNSSSYSSSRSSSDGMAQVGYNVRREYKITIPVNIESLDKLLEITDACLKEGAKLYLPFDSSSGSWSSSQKNTSIIEFMQIDTTALTQKAMNDAIARARKLAEDAAKGMGKTSANLVKVQMIGSQNTTTMRTSSSSYDYTPITTVPAWEPIKVSVTVETSFSCD